MKHLHSLTWKLVYFTANVAVVFGQGNKKAASTCESENSSGVLMFKACFTEAQQLLRIENLLKDITVIPRNSTCGNPPSNYCRLEEDSNDCEQLCDATTPLVSHPVTMAVDALMSTWWQSISWLSYPIPLEITFTLSFNKLYRLTDDLVVTFHSARPRSMVIERSIDNGVTWETWQYYSKDCLTFFNIPPSSSLGDDSRAIICSQSYSDTLPYSGGNVVFDVLSRYQIYLGAEFNDITSLYQSYNSTNWQRFLQFTDIRLNLLYPATDGEELNAGINLLKYYYAISNIDITAVCSCNLHASSCRVEGRQTLCECRHNTAGINCEQCLPLYNNREWRPGYYLPVGQGEANECQECECNNHADACIYNRTLGHGVCLDCRDSTIGPFCNTCADGFYSNSTLPLNSTDICIECLCDTSGTVAGDIKCDEKGVCACKDNVIGDKCDTCAPHYYGLNTYGECLPCKCTEFGTISGSVCDDDMGQCHCKVTTFGRTCSQCIESYYSFPSAWDEECLACNCVLGSSTNSHCSEDTGQCDCLPNLEGRTCSLVKSGFYLPSPLIEFGLDSTDCSVVYESMEQSSQWLSTARQQQVLPVACGSTGHVIYSVTVDFPQIHHLFRKYVLGIRYRSPSPSTLSLAMFAGSGCSYGQEVNLNLTIPASQNFSLHFSEHLLELTTNCQYDITVVTHAINESITLHTLVLAADWSQFSVYNEIGGANETDLCYDWLLSERNDSRCRLLVHSSMSELYGGARECHCDIVGTVPNTSCDAYGGQCMCQPGVTGKSCDQCKTGYYGFSTSGCTKCDCDVIGSSHSVCNSVTGQCVCRKLVANFGDLDTYGVPHLSLRCEVCQFGSYLLSSSGCASCNCNTTGSVMEQCIHSTGECQCKDGVGGAECNQCLPGFYQFSQSGCRPCECDSQGSTSNICDVWTGQCPCKGNTKGRVCSECVADTFGLSSGNSAGCTPCYCSTHSSGQCLPATGFSQAKLFLADVTDIKGGWEFVSLLPSYGHVITAYVTPTNRSIELADSILSIYSTTETREVIELQYLAQQAVPIGSGTKTMMSLTESHWVLKSSGRFPSRDQFMHVLHTKPIIRFHDDLQYTAVSVNIATEEDMTSQTEPHSGVENCTCSPDSNTQGLSCDQCKDGFRRQDFSLGSHNVCVPCNCFDRTDGPPLCHPNTGVCENCRVGTRGDFCESCDSHVTGSSCSLCQDSYWGLQTLGECVECHCDVTRSVNSTCHQLTGQCHCKEHVGGVKCDTCQLNHHTLSSVGCNSCHECYSLVGNKIEQLSSSIMVINETVLSTTLHNRTFEEDLGYVTDLVTRLTHELVAVSDMNTNISAKITEWQGYTTDTPSSLVSALGHWNTTLLSINNSRSYYYNLSDWLDQRLALDTATIDELALGLANQSLMQYDKEFSALDNLVKLSGNITISLEDQLSNLTLRQTEIVAADQLAEDITTAAVNTLSETLLIQENITSTLSALLLIQNNVSERRSQIDQSLPLIEEYILTINQSLLSLKTSPPITDNVTLVSADNEKVLFEIVKLYEKINSTVINLDLFNETSARNQNLVDDTVGRSENLSVLVQRHLADIEGLHGEMIESVSSLKSDYSYLMGISKLMSDFQLEMAEIKKPIAASLTTLWQIRNLTVTRADRARTLSQRLLRAQRLADTLRSESNDIYSKTMLQRELLVNLNRTAFDLFSQVSEVSTDVYLRNMTEIVDSIVTVHNRTCKTLANEIQTLKIRYFARKNTTETQQLEVERLSIQFADVESLLDNLESTDYDVIHELENKIVEISENVETFLPLIEALNASLASQHLDISEAELRLTSLLQNIEELESL